MKARKINVGNDLICEDQEHTISVPATIAINSQYGVIEYMCRDHAKALRKALKEALSE